MNDDAFGELRVSSKVHVMCNRATDVGPEYVAFTLIWRLQRLFLGCLGGAFEVGGW